MIDWPVDVLTDGNVSAGVTLWRAQGRLLMTVMVKATFALVHEAMVAPMPPMAILREDRPGDRAPYRSLEAASDLAPYLARCDVTFTGSAYAPRGEPTTAASVRLAVFRDRHPLLDKTLHVFGDREGGARPSPFTKMPLVYERAFGGRAMAVNPVGTDAPNILDPRDPRRPGGFGAISRRWPSRVSLLGAVPLETLECAVPQIPDAMPWSYYQSAPADQQIDHLCGGEWLVLDYLHPTLPRVQTQLMQARGAARVIARADMEAHVALVADTLTIDGERQQCSIVWRGRHEVAGGEASLPSMSVSAGLEMPGRPVDWVRIAGAARRRGTAVSTVEIPAVSDLARSPFAREHPVASNPAVPPFAMAPPRPEGAPPSGDASATPWGGAALRPAPLPMAQQSVTMTLQAVEAAPPHAVVPPRPPLVSSPPAPAEPPAPPPLMIAPPAHSSARSSSVPRERRPSAPDPAEGSAPREPAPAAMPASAREDPGPVARLTERLRRAGAGAEELDELMKVLLPR